MSQSACQTKSYQVLLIDDDTTIRDNLTEYLNNYHDADYEIRIIESANAEEALEKLQSQPFDLVICDINLPDHDGFYILKQAKRLHPKIKTALITAYELDAYIKMALQEKIYNIITKAAPFDFTELSTVVNNLLEPEKAFGLENYIQEDGTSQQIVLKCSDDIMKAHDELKLFFNRFGFANVDAMSVVLVEAITNAVYHSPKKPDGSLRYQKGEPIEKLPEDEQVIITYGSDDEKIGISIRDQGGTITADEILYWLERNISGNSLMDTHGRGIFLIHRLMDRVIININRGKTTEIILLRYLTERPSENRPLYINEITN